MVSGGLRCLGREEEGAVVEADLGVERVHGVGSVGSGGLEDQRIDLGQVAVTVDVAVVQLHQYHHVAVMAILY